MLSLKLRFRRYDIASSGIVSGRSCPGAKSVAAAARATRFSCVMLLYAGTKS